MSSELIICECGIIYSKIKCKFQDKEYVFGEQTKPNGYRCPICKKEVYHYE